MPRMNMVNWSGWERRDATWTHGDIATWTANFKIMSKKLSLFLTIS